MPAKLCGRTPHPAGIEENCTRQGDEIGVASGHNVLGLFCVSDQTNSGGGQT